MTAMKRLASSKSMGYKQSMKDFAGDVLNHDFYGISWSVGMKASAGAQEMEHILSLCKDVEEGHIHDARARELLVQRALRWSPARTSNSDSNQIEALKHAVLLEFIDLLPDCE